MERWIALVIVFFLVFISLLVFIIENGNYDAYELTTEQKAILQNPSTDGLILGQKLLTVTTLDTSYFVVGIMTGILTIVFIMAVLLFINQFIPFT